MLAGLLLFVVIIGAVVAVWRMQVVRRLRTERAAGESAPVGAGKATAEHLAFLVGGPGRAAECALAALVEQGFLRVNREGWVCPAGQARGLSRMQTAVISAVGPHTQRSGNVVGTASRSTAAAALAEELRTMGLLAPPSTWRRRLKRPSDRAQWQPPLQRDWENSQLVRNGWIGPSILGTTTCAVAVGGFAAYPNPEQAEALMSGYQDGHSVQGGPGGGYGGGCGGGSSDGGGGGGCGGGGCGGGGCGGGGCGGGS